MEEKFNEIRTVLGAFGEDAFYNITISRYGISFQGEITIDSIAHAENLGYTKDKTVGQIRYSKGNDSLIFT
jgi:DNA-binding winged helix-turn-helix (wHTH) protein